LEQQDLNKRLILALVLSFFVFVGYGYFFPQQQAVQNVEQTANTNSAIAHQTPTVTTTSPSSSAAPATTQQASNAPVVTSSATVLAVVTSDTFKMSIDELGRIAQFELLEEKYRDEEGKNLQILGANKVKPLEVRFSDAKLNDEAFKKDFLMQN